MLFSIPICLLFSVFSVWEFLAHVSYRIGGARTPGNANKNSLGSAQRGRRGVQTVRLDRKYCCDPRHYLLLRAAPCGCSIPAMSPRTAPHGPKSLREDLLAVPCVAHHARRSWSRRAKGFAVSCFDDWLLSPWRSSEISDSCFLMLLFGLPISPPMRLPKSIFIRKEMIHEKKRIAINNASLEITVRLSQFFVWRGRSVRVLRSERDPTDAREMAMSQYILFLWK